MAMAIGVGRTFLFAQVDVPRWRIVVATNKNNPLLWSAWRSGKEEGKVRNNPFMELLSLAMRGL